MKRKSTVRKSPDVSHSRKQLKLWESPSNHNKNPVCPMCNLSLPFDLCMNNLHIDKCLRRSFVACDKMITDHIFRKSSSCTDYNVRSVSHPAGLWIIYDFLSPVEEELLMRDIDISTGQLWMYSSFNGHCLSKYFSVKTEFGLPGKIRMVRRNDNLQEEPDLPPFLQPYMDRLRSIVSNRCDLPPELRSFKPNECNINNYVRSDGHYLRPHFDDRALSGPVLVNLLLAGFARMTYSSPSDKGAVGIAVDLPRRSLQLVTGPARWSFMHEIKAADVLDPRRVSVTWRQSGKRGSGGRSREQCRIAAAANGGNF